MTVACCRLQRQFCLQDMAMLCQDVLCKGRWTDCVCVVQVYYTVDKIGEGKGKDWKGGVGYVTQEMATEHIPPPSDDHLILVCGPPPMYKALSGEKKSPKDQGKLICCLAD